MLFLYVLPIKMEQLKNISTLTSDLLNWVRQKNNDLSLSIGDHCDDMKSLQQHNANHEMLILELEAKSSVIENTIATARNTALKILSFSRKASASSSASDGSEEESIMEDINKFTVDLEKEWLLVQKQSEQLKNQIYNRLPVVQELCDHIELCNEFLQQLEVVQYHWKPVGTLPVESLSGRILDFDAFCKTSLYHITCLDKHVTRVKKETEIPSDALKQIEDIHRKWKVFDACCTDRRRELIDAVRDFGPDSQLFLSASVTSPWERVVTDDNIPYYMDHMRQLTSWDHPKMIELMDSMVDLNSVQYAAYRTAMKLLRLQKALCLDLLSLKQVQDAFNQQEISASFDNPDGSKAIGISKMINCLTTLYDILEQDYKALVSVPLCVDMCLNWLLNVYDTKRLGVLKALSFKTAIVCLCKASLEDKYRYLFCQVAQHTGFVDEKRLGELIWCLMKIPWQLGEADAFGSTVPEPCVASCFQLFLNQPEIDGSHFMDWIKLEPQPLVWISVMHRIISAENVIHPAICAICKECPITGLRYKSLRQFRYNICQSCFLSGRVALRKTIGFPFVEYCTPTTSTENLKDFAKILKNKIKGGSSKSNIGYLPVASGSKEFQKVFVQNPANKSGTAVDEMVNGKASSGESLINLSPDANSQTSVAPKLRGLDDYDIGINCPLEEEHQIIIDYCEAVSKSFPSKLSDKVDHRHSAIFAQNQEFVPFSGSYVKSKSEQIPPSFEQSKRKSQYGLLDLNQSSQQNLFDLFSANDAPNERISTPLKRRTPSDCSLNDWLLENKLASASLTELEVIICLT